MPIQRINPCKLLAAALLAGSLSAATHAASGTIRHNSKTMKLQAAVGVWNAAENQLRVALLPFAPTAAEITEIRRSGALFVAAERPSPDSTIGAHPPFAELVIEFEPGTTIASPQKITHYRLEVSWLDRMNNTTTMNRNSQDEVRRELKSLGGGLREGGAVQLSLQGADSVFDDRLDWNFQVNATVYTGR
jgi:hypothetical protein